VGLLDKSCAELASRRAEQGSFRISQVSASSRWAYRTAADSAQFRKAVVLTVGDKRPPRVRIELIADEWQGERR
jgi:hypothetical protein